MAIVKSLQSFECLNQLVNGDDFTSNTSDTTEALVGNVGEKVLLKYSFKAYWEAHSSVTDAWTINNLGGTSHELIAERTNFKNEGFKIGDNIMYDDAYSEQTIADDSDAVWIGEITFISDNGRRIEFTGLSGTVTGGTDLEDSQIVAHVGGNSYGNSFDQLKLKFGLIENNEGFNNISKVSGNAMAYFIDNIAYPSTNTMQPLSPKRGWQTGSAELTVATTNSVGTFTIEHELIIAPTLPVGLDVENGPVPDYFAGDSALKYAFEVELKPNRTSNRTIRFIEEDFEGNTGWYSENFNGFPSDYSASASFTDNSSGDSVDALQALIATDFEITLSTTGTAFAAGDPVAIYLQKQPTQSADVQDTTTTFEENHQYHSLVLTEGAAAVNSNIWSNVQAAISGSDLVITGTVELSPTEKAAVEPGDNYLLTVTHHPAAISAPNSPRVMTIASYRSYILETTIQGLASFNYFNILKHNEVQGKNSGKISVAAWNEDGLLLDFELVLDKSRNALLESIDFVLAADDGSSYWAIDKYTIDLSTALINGGGTQLVDIDTERGYKLPDGDQFNAVRMFYDRTSGTDDIYQGYIGIKTRWEQWIRDNSVDSVFYDNTKTNDNLNKKTSNYDDANGYQVKIIAVVNTTGEDSVGNSVVGLDTKKSASNEIYDYEETDDGVFTAATITLLDPDTLADTDGVILRSKDTLFRIDWTMPGATDIPNTWVIHRIQRNKGTGQQIEELSSIRSNLSNGILKPKPGESGPTLVDVSGNVRSECLIDHTKLGNENYDLSGRISIPIDFFNNSVSFHLRDALSSNTWEVPFGVDVLRPIIKVVPFDCDSTNAAVLESSLTYELDTGDGSGFTSYGNNFNTFANALESATPAEFFQPVQVKISTSTTGYIDAGLILQFDTDTEPTGQTIDNIPYALPAGNQTEGQIDQDTIVYFAELIQLNSIIDTAGGAVYAALRTDEPSTEDYTQFVEVYDGSSVNTTNIDSINDQITDASTSPPGGLTKGVWQSGITYNIGDIVRDTPTGDFYRATAQNTNDQPPSTNWDQCDFRFALHIWSEALAAGSTIEVLGNYVNYDLSNNLQTPSTTNAVLAAINGSNIDRDYKHNIDSLVGNRNPATESDVTTNISDTWTQFDQNQAFTLFFVYYDNGEQFQLITETCSARNGSSQRAGGIRIFSNNGQIVFKFFDADSDQMDVRSDISAKNPGYNIVQISWDGNGNGTPSGLNMYINGQESSTTTVFNDLGTDSIVFSGRFPQRLCIACSLFEIIGSGLGINEEIPPIRIGRISMVDYVQSVEELREDFNNGQQSAPSGNFLFDCVPDTASYIDNGPAGYTFTGSTTGDDSDGNSVTVNNTRNYTTQNFYQ